MKILEDKLNVFSLGQLQDFKTISKVLINLDISLPQFIQYVEDIIDTVVISKPPRPRISHKTPPKTPHKQCPECSAYMIPFPVNVSPSTQVDKQYNSVWMCSNKTCMETIYTPDTIHDIIKAATKAVTNDIASSTSNAGGG